MENIKPVYFNRLAYVQSKVSSDEYRISISGNLVVAPPKNTFSYQ